MWYFRTPRGTAIIRKVPAGYELWFDHDCLGCYDSPYAAADDVSGGYTWSDYLTRLSDRGKVPDDLDGWVYTGNS